MAKTEQFVGIDIETTTGDGNGAIIQVGISLGTEADQNITRDVRPAGWMLQDVPGTSHDREKVFFGEVPWEPGAFKVHGILPQRVTKAPPIEVVEDELVLWLNERGIGPRDGIAVGWNVGSFDMAHIRRLMPHLAAMFHYRAVDLNSLVFGLAEHGKRYAKAPDKVRGYEGWKKLAKRYAADVMGGEPQWHDAGYDARASLLAFHFLTMAHAVE